MVTKENILKALKKVIDPEIGLNIVELGLIYDIKINNGEVMVDMTLTSPGCPVAPRIMADAEVNMLNVKGVKKAKIEFVFDPPWTPEKMSADARMLLGI